MLRLYEIQGKKPHEPTAKELKKQAEEAAWRARYRSDAAANRKVYRTWDYFPSGRLTIALRDTNSYSWRERELSKRWRDRKGKTLEDQLAEVFVWLEPASVMAKQKRLEIEERRRRETAEAERRRLARERREQAGKLEKYLIERPPCEDRPVGRIAGVLGGSHRFRVGNLATERRDQSVSRDDPGTTGS